MQQAVTKTASMLAFTTFIQDKTFSAKNRLYSEW